MPRYVVLYHQMPPDSQRDSHWDLMLEHEGVLWTWALSAEPTQDQTAQRLKDHRPIYLEYEGPLSGGRGAVSRWDRGVYQTVATQTDEWTVDLSEGRLAGRIRLSRVVETTWDYSWQRHHC